LAFVVDAGADAGADADGADDAFGGGDYRAGVLDVQLGGEAEIGATLLQEAGSAGVATDEAEIAQAALIADRSGIGPVEGMLFDVGTFGVVADGAFAGVTFESGEGGIVVVGVEFRRDDLIDFFDGSFLMLGRGFAMALGVAVALHRAMGLGLFSEARFPLGAGLAFLFGRECGVRGETILQWFRGSAGRWRRNGLDDLRRTGKGLQFGHCGGWRLEFALAFSGCD
jgi:hypothetical protein